MCNIPLLSLAVVKRINDTFSLSVGSAFPIYRDVGVSARCSYSLQNLPVKTGIKIARNTGRVYGAPTVADADMPQPMEITVEAACTAPGGGSGGFYTLPFRMLVTEEHFTGHAPKAVGVMHDEFRYLGRPFTLNVTKFFRDPDDHPLFYVLVGLQRGTGIRIDSKTGMISGSTYFQSLFLHSYALLHTLPSSLPSLVRI